MKKIILLIILTFFSFNLYPMEGQRLKRARHIPTEPKEQLEAAQEQPKLKQAKILSSEFEVFEQELEELIEFSNLPSELKELILTFLTADNLINLFKNFARASQAERQVYDLSCNENLIRYLINTHIRDQFKKGRSSVEIINEVIQVLEFIQKNLKKYEGATSESLLEIIARIYKPIVQNLSKDYLVSQNIDIIDLHNNLKMAIKIGNLDDVRLILAAGTNPNAKFGKGKETALILAIKNPEIVKTLLLAGADPNEQTGYGKLFLVEAANGNYVEVLKILFKYYRQQHKISLVQASQKIL